MDRALSLEVATLAKTRKLQTLSESGNSEIQKFFAGKTVLLTGGTGFLGKQLTEKLLRSCRDIKKVYMLIRTKKGNDAKQRIEQQLSETVYDELRKYDPNFGAKITAVAGDTSELGLGLSDTDRNTLMDDVDVIFHVAAIVRFDEPIKKAVLTNARGTRELLHLAAECRKLCAFVHFSTAYVHCPRPEIEEKFYPSPVPSDLMIEMVETTDEEVLQRITPGLIGDWPNTYSYSKAITEDIVHRLAVELKIPVAVVTPAIAQNDNAMKNQIKIIIWVCETREDSVAVWCGRSPLRSGALVVDWLVRNGARSVLLQSDYRDNADTAYLQVKLRYWSKAGADIHLLVVTEPNPEKRLQTICSVKNVHLRTLLLIEPKCATELYEIQKKAMENCPQLRYITALTAHPGPVPNWQLNENLSRGTPKTFFLHAPKLFEQDKSTPELNYLNSVMQILDVGLRVSGCALTLLQSDFQDETEIVHTVCDETVEQVRARGLASLFTQIETDELNSAVELILMPTLVHNGSEGPQDLDSKDIYLTIVPGFDEHPDTFRLLCERLRLPTVLLQPGAERLTDDVHRAADHYLKMLSKMIVFHDHFYLIGHTFSVLVALEMAAHLENRGLVGTVFLVDSSPDALPAQLAALLQLETERGADDPGLQDSVVEHICCLLAGEGASAEPSVWALRLRRAVCAERDWPDKVMVGVRQLRGRVAHSFQYARARIETAYARICAALIYSAEALEARPLRSQLVLARRPQLQGAKALPHDLGLSRLSVTPVAVHELTTAGGIADPLLPSIIKNYMRPQEIERFFKRDSRNSYQFIQSIY